MTKITVFMGSFSDEDKMCHSVQVFDKLGPEHIFTVTSAHRTPECTARLIVDLKKNRAARLTSAPRAWLRTWPEPWPPRRPSRSSTCFSRPRPWAAR